MTMDPWTLAVIAAMATVTYACRAGGYVVFRRISPGPTLRALFGYLPGALFVSYVVPALAEGRSPHWAGAVVTLGVMAATRSLVASIALGTGVAWVVWAA